MAPRHHRFSEAGAEGLLLRVGDLFGWAGAGSVVMGSVGDQDWTQLRITLFDNHIDALGERWTIERREGHPLS